MDWKDDDLLTAKQVADHLGIKGTAFGEARRTGQIPEPIRIGTTLRWRWGTLRKWIEAVALVRQATPKYLLSDSVVMRRESSESNDSSRSSPDAEIPASQAKKAK